MNPPILKNNKPLKLVIFYFYKQKILIVLSIRTFPLFSLILLLYF
nr:MAG TPA_asm: hypothetical protein [Caudoviricetes sp.]